MGLVEDREHDAAQVEEHLDSIEYFVRIAMLGVILWC